MATECVESFNMDWRILVLYPVPDLFRFLYV